MRQPYTTWQSFVMKLESKMFMLRILDRYVTVDLRATHKLTLKAT